ncbi:hypothetical protein SBOR_7845 [Sclerotinia borealis F-4128]|uniref:Mediator of RNA polymerase II transcription subunit 4 n=1 Tax=Sclerotinia borealis (strain F-4128) TaxID=1432307 RepID=W9CB48_SCLBF|nr:hypothetical protein SBOR_7845 [Sclerotinia borealis F-4128]
MDKIIDARFDRVEKALASLIASISKYNPVPALAQDLVLADQELNDGLSLLNQHQHNTYKLTTLHATSAALDTQVREFTLLLNSTRSELLNTSSSEYPEDKNLVEYEELLSYARKISKFTVPPEARLSKLEDTSSKQDGVATNGSTTPNVTVMGNGANGTSMDLDISSITPSNGTTSLAPSQDPVSQQPSQTQTALDAETTRLLNTGFDLRPFVPWAREDDIKMGALASLQVLVDSGIDPEGWDPEIEEQKKREKVEEAEREAEAERMQEEEKRRLEMERRNNAMSGVQGGTAAERPKVFQLDEFDDDDD